MAGFVLPLGVDMNLDGSGARLCVKCIGNPLYGGAAGVYYPLAVLFLALVGGLNSVCPSSKPD